MTLRTASERPASAGAAGDIRRLHLAPDAAPWQQPGDAPPLAVLLYVRQLPAAAAAAAALVVDSGTSPLGPTVAADRFGDGSAVERGRHGLVDWSQDAHWLFGSIDLVAGRADDLEPLARRAYDAVFACLAARGMPHLLRLWNYLPDINTEQSGLERYRRFNAGRQQAFLAAGRAAFEGAPAACGLGVPADGPLRIRFLAGREAAVAIENPRQVSAYHYPSEYGPRAPTFSRAAIVAGGAGRRLLLVSGTASIVGHESRHAGDLVAQVDETVCNLRAVVAAACQSARDAHGAAAAGDAFALADARFVVYVRRAGDAAAVLERLTTALGPDATALRDAVVVQADICRRELLIEVEAHIAARVGADEAPAAGAAGGVPA